MTCHYCGASASAATYRLIAIERETWRSIYVCSQACAESLRAAHMAPQRPATAREAHVPTPAPRQARGDARPEPHQLALALEVAP